MRKRNCYDTSFLISRAPFQEPLWRKNNNIETREIRLNERNTLSSYAKYMQMKVAKKRLRSYKMMKKKKSILNNDGDEVSKAYCAHAKISRAH